MGLNDNAKHTLQSVSHSRSQQTGYPQMPYSQHQQAAYALYQQQRRMKMNKEDNIKDKKSMRYHNINVNMQQNLEIKQKNTTKNMKTPKNIKNMKIMKNANMESLQRQSSAPSSPQKSGMKSRYKNSYNLKSSPNQQEISSNIMCDNDDTKFD